MSCRDERRRREDALVKVDDAVTRGRQARGDDGLCAGNVAAFEDDLKLLGEPLVEETDLAYLSLLQDRDPFRVEGLLGGGVA